MLKNYLRTTLRTLGRQPGYAFINVASLAVGIACCVLLLLFVRDEWTFDRFHERSDQIYRLHRVTYDPDGTVNQRDVYLPMPLGPALESEVSDVQRAVRFCSFLSHFVRKGAVTIDQPVLYADPTFFGVFSVPLERGDPATALEGRRSVVLSEAAAETYFGAADPLGQTLEIRLGDQYEAFTVTGVAEPLPSNSSIQFDVLMPFHILTSAFEWLEGSETNWYRSAFITYVELAEGSTLPSSPERLLQFRRAHYPEEAADSLAQAGAVPATYAMQALPEIHLGPSVPGGISSPSSPRNTYILFGIALAVLLIACINFMTLALGRSVRRAREVGVRKVVGASRRQLVAQFWGEALVLTTLGLAAGLVLAEVLLPFFNELAGKELRLAYLEGLAVPALLFGLVVVTALVAGSYPALVLSGYQPVDTLKSTLRPRGGRSFTKALVAFQFALSVFFIASTLVMLRQLDYLRDAALGFDQEHVVALALNGVDGQVALERMRQAMQGRTEVVGLTAASSSLGAEQGWSRTGFAYGEVHKEVFEYLVEPNYVDLMGMELVAGRGFDAERASDAARAVVVNEAFVRDFGWDQPLGQVITGYTDEADTDPVVIGVVRDYHYRSLHADVEPMLLAVGNAPDAYRALLVRIQPGRTREALALLERAWEGIAPEVPFTYSFMDDDLGRFYQAEERWSQIVGAAALLAILIACLGLFGLAALAAARRTKEVGIRKVLGASVPGLAGLLSKEFALLALLASLVAGPAAYLVMQRWLSGFAYRVDLGMGSFLLAAGLVLVLALATVSYQTIKAALADPVESLRYE